MVLIFHSLRNLCFGPRDPFTRAKFDFLQTSRDDFLFALVQRRQVYDNRARSENLNNWPLFRFWEAIEGVMLSAAEANARSPEEIYLLLKFLHELIWLWV